MLYRSDRLRRSATAGSSWVLAALILAAPGQAQDAKKTGETPLYERSGAEFSADEQERSKQLFDVGELEPPDGQWLKDESGREYFVRRLLKSEVRFMLLANDRVRINHFQVYPLDSMDEESLSVRVYRVGDVENIVRPKVPTEEELVAAAAEYEVDLAEVDRLEFVSFDEGLPRQGQWRNGFDIADMNEDGHLDIAHCPPRKGRSGPIIFLGDGQGSWRGWEDMNFPRAPYDYGDAVVDDFNDDGHADIALGIHLRGVMVLVGDGKGGFTTWSRGIQLEVPGRGGAADSFSSRALTTADWNGDGRVDLIALGEGPRPTGQSSKSPGLLNSASYGVVVYLNRGDGSWQTLSRGNQLGEVFGDSVVAEDLNQDGRYDLVTASNARGFKELIHFNDDGDIWRSERLDAVRTGAYIRQVETGDFDGDGHRDLALAYTNNHHKVWRTGIDIVYGREDGTWERRNLMVEEDRRGVFALDSGDLDGDGQADLVAVTGEGEILVFVGDGAGFFRREASPELEPPSAGCRGYRVRLADLDGDGRDEFVAGFAGEPSAMFAPEKCLSRGGLMAWKANLRGAGVGMAAGAP